MTPANLNGDAYDPCPVCDGKGSMSRKNCWPLDGRTLRFGIDTDVNIRWATDPDEEEAKLLAEWPEEKCMKYVNTL